MCLFAGQGINRLPGGGFASSYAATTKLNGSSKRRYPLGRGVSGNSPAPDPTPTAKGGGVGCGPGLVQLAAWSVPTEVSPVQFLPYLAGATRRGRAGRGAEGACQC
jgi:hypothetical protein